MPSALGDKTGMSASGRETDAHRFQVLANARVLVADDDRLTRALITAALAKVGANVTEAANGDQALQFIEHSRNEDKPFRLILLDMLMPGVNGMHVLATMRKHPELSGTRVIVFSGVEDQRVVDQCARFDIAAYLIKPQTAQNVLEACLTAVSGTSKLPKKIEATNAECRTEEEPAAPKAEPVLPAGAGESPIGFPYEFMGLPVKKPRFPLRRTYCRCPFCATTFTAPRLVDRAMKPDPEDKLLLGLFRDPFERDYINAFLINTITCPSCCFTCDRFGFRINTRAGTQSFAQAVQIPEKDWPGVSFEVNSAAEQAIRTKRDARLKLCRTADGRGRALFAIDADNPKLPRAHSDALVAFDLALLSLKTIRDCYQEEPGARLQHRIALFMLRKAHLLGLIAGGDPEGGGHAEQRVKTLQEAFIRLHEVNDVEFRELSDRLVCMTRRFWLSDLLTRHARDGQQREKFHEYRRQTLSNMKMLRLEQINNKTGQHRRVERFMTPLEIRMEEVELEMKAKDAA